MTAIPEYTGERVYVRDVADVYQGLNQTIKDLERSSPQSYFVVVIRSAGPGDDAAVLVDLRQNADIVYRARLL